LPPKWIMHFLSQKGNSNAGAATGRTKGTQAAKAKESHALTVTGRQTHLDTRTPSDNWLSRRQRINSRLRY